MNVEEAILTRRSVRRFLPKPVPEPIVGKIIEVSARAPSGHNIQPWKVYAIAGEVEKRLSADILKAAETEPGKHQPEHEYYPTEWHEPYIGRRRELGYDLYAKLGIARDDVAARTSHMNRNYLFFDAPVGLFVTVDRRLNTGSYIDIGMFLQNILLAARGHGLHTCGQAAFTWYHDIIREHLSFDGTEILICGVALGYEDTAAPENKLVTKRVPVDTYARFLGFSGSSADAASRARRPEADFTHDAGRKPNAFHS
jgi:nitroreductase